MHGYITHSVTLPKVGSVKKIQQDESPHICLGSIHCNLSYPKIARHTRIPTTTATINPKTPAIMSQSELRILLSIHCPLFKDHSPMQCREQIN